MGVTLRTFVGGELETNAYLVVDDATGEAILIDAPDGITEDVVATAREEGWTITRIVLTHAHWDHIVDAAALKAATGVPLLAHPLAAERLASPDAFAGGYVPVKIAPVTPDGFLNDGDSVTVGSYTFAVMHLPGHDPAHIALINEPELLMFGGDVIFPGGHGNTAIAGADQAVMNQSLRRLAALPPDLVVYPGHGEPTTLGAEAGWLRSA
ncbi:MAG: MBL fold metallo-hydrolase [Chloroflexota bacterium]|nr:MBL fold metallo-hydrolase [Chloroflexota bacterium]